MNTDTRTAATGVLYDVGDLLLTGTLPFDGNIVQILMAHVANTPETMSARRKEEIDDAHSGHLRFNIGLLSRRLAVVTRELVADTRSQGLRMGYFGSSTGGAAALRAAAISGSTIGAVVSRGGRPNLAGLDALAAVTAPTPRRSGVSSSRCSSGIGPMHSSARAARMRAASMPTAG